MSVMAVIWLFPNALARWHRNLRGLSHESRWVKSAENLYASPLKRYPFVIQLSAKPISLDSPFK
jgi:hypothetical protein